MHNNEVWIKKDAEKDLLDVPTGSYHGAEVCELIGLFLLNNLSQILPKDSYVLYRNDGLLIIKRRSKRIIEQTGKCIRAVFSEQNLKIKIESDSCKTDFLDVSLDLQNETYYPHRKCNAKEMYININSNHPPSVKKELPNMIQNRLSALSKNKVMFNKYKEPYEKSLKNSGFNKALEYSNQNENNATNGGKRRKRRKKTSDILQSTFQFNSKNKIRKRDLKLVDKHFPKDGPLNKIFNRNTIKISYSCMPNVES